MAIKGNARFHGARIFDVAVTEPVSGLCRKSKRTKEDENQPTEKERERTMAKE